VLASIQVSSITGTMHRPKKVKSEPKHSDTHDSVDSTEDSNAWSTDFFDYHPRSHEKISSKALTDSDFLTQLAEIPSGDALDDLLLQFHDSDDPHTSSDHSKQKRKFVYSYVNTIFKLEGKGLEAYGTYSIQDFS
jgi:hypothetical protein